MRNQKRLIVLLFLLLNLSCVSFAKPIEITYLIPEGFTGGVIVVFNQPDGITPETTKEGSIIFQVPKDGLIKVKQPLDRTAYNLKYYFVDDKGNRTPIEYLYPKNYVKNPGDTTSRNIDEVSEGESNNKIFASFHETTNFNVGGKKVYIHSFIIEKPAITLKTYMGTSDRMSSIQEELMGIKQTAPQKQN